MSYRAAAKWLEGSAALRLEYRPFEKGSSVRNMLMDLFADRVSLFAGLLLVSFGSFLTYVALAGSTLHSTVMTVITGVAAFFTIMAAHVAMRTLKEWRDSNYAALKRDAATRLKNLTSELEIIRVVLDQHLLLLADAQNHPVLVEGLQDLGRKDKHVIKLIGEIEAACREVEAIDPQAKCVFSTRAASLAVLFKESSDGLASELPFHQGTGINAEKASKLVEKYILAPSIAANELRETVWAYYLAALEL